MRLQPDLAAPRQVADGSPKEEGYYLAKGGWKKVKPKDPNAVEAAGDATKGAALFKAKCATCHSVLPNGPAGQGPNLYNIMGKPAATSGGFKFTKAIKTADITWDKESMFAWLENPKAFVKGTSMAFQGFKKEQDRNDVIAYLSTLNPDAPPPEKKKH